MKLLFTVAAISGFVGGFIGNPADIANVPLRNDRSVAPNSRRNYRNVLDAFSRMKKEEGLRGLYRGLWANCTRAALMTSCQLASYDGFKNA